MDMGMLSVTVDASQVEQALRDVIKDLSAAEESAALELPAVSVVAGLALRAITVPTKISRRSFFGLRKRSV